jgi:hypothetical protein
MNAGAEYAGALWPPQYRAFGLWLEPCSIAHLLVLARMDSPMLKDGIPDWDEALKAAWICSAPWPRAVARVRTGGLGWRGKLWLWRTMLACALRPDWAIIQLAALRGYVLASVSPPETWTEEGAGNDAAANRVPALVALKTSLQKELGYSHADAMACTPARAAWELACLGASAGFVRFVDDDDRELMSEADKIKLAVEKGEL